METDYKILERLIRNHTNETIHIIDKLEIPDIVGFLQSLPTELSSLLFSQIDRLKAARCIESADQGMQIELIESLTPSIAGNILRLLDQKHSSAILEGVSSRHSSFIRQILKYPANTVGAYLDPWVLTLSEEISLAQGLEKIKSDQAYVKSPVFILSSEQKLVGSIDLRDFLTDDLTKSIQSVMDIGIPKVLANHSLSLLAEGKIGADRFPILPVVDIDNVFLGIFDKSSSLVEDQDKISQDHLAHQTSIALSDLYQIGLTSLFRDTSELFRDTKSK
jgi:magnesium transporter